VFLNSSVSSPASRTFFKSIVFCNFEIRASDKCQREKRKTINGDDLLWAMDTLGFEEYVEPLKIYLQKYKEVRDFLRKFRAVD